MDLHYLWLFYKVAQHHSFSKAAEELMISQPTISMQVKKLESELGVNLFDRFGKKIYLSHEGEFIYSYAMKIFETVQELNDQLAIQKGKIIGNINIGASNTPGAYILPHIIGIFKKEYPDINVNLHIRNTHIILNMITSNQVDFAVIGGDYDYPKSFKTIKLLDDSIVIIGSHKNSLTQKEYASPGELINQPFISPEPDSSLFDFTQYIIKNDLKIPINISMMLGNISAIKHAVAADLGISFVPLSSVKSNLESGMLRKISVQDKVWKYPFYLVYYSDKNLNLPLKLLIKTIEERFRDFS